MKSNRTQDRTASRALTVLCVLVLMLTAAFALSSCSRPAVEDENSYLRLISGGKKLEIKAELGVSDVENVGLFAIEPWQTESDIKNMLPLAECNVNDGVAHLKYTVEDELSVALCRGYLFGAITDNGYTPVSGVFYVSNPRDAHKTGSDEDSPLGNIKGAIATPYQLLDLGAGSTVVTVDISEILAPEGGTGQIGFIRNGYSCYVNRDAVERLDRQIKSYTDAGIYVFLELIQSKSYDELPAGLKCIAFPGAKNASGYALNMSDKAGAIKLCGLFNFLSERYSSGGEYGTAEAFIIGRNVNNFPKFYAGESSSERSVINYMSAVRAAYSILLSHTPSGRVYVAIDNNWNISNYNARDFLATAAAVADDGGDFFWQLSIEANSSNAALSAIWTDNIFSDLPDFVSPANIEVISNLLKTGQYTCAGKTRNILLNRFAVGGSNEEERAASYAYAYYKCLDSGNVDGLIYASYSDPTDGGIKNGLCTAPTASGASENKLIADIFTTIDCLSDGQVLSIGKTVGTAFDTLYENNREKAELRRVTMIGESRDTSEKNIEIVTSFSDGDTFGFSGVSAEYVELRHQDGLDRPILHARLTTDGGADGAGVISGLLKTDVIRSSGYIGISGMASGVGTREIDVTVRISGKDKNGNEMVLIGMSRTANGAWFESYYDLTEFLNDVKGSEVDIALLVSPTDGGGSVSDLWISQIAAAEPAPTPMPSWIGFTLIGVLVAIALVALIIWFRKHYTLVRD